MKWFQFFLAVVMSVVVRAQLPSDPAEYRAWESQALQDIASARAEKDMKPLTRWVFNMKSPRKREPEPRPVYRAACEAVISLPNHADYFRKALDAQMRLEFAEAGGQPREPGAGFRRPELFGIMGELRSPEIVGLLGEMLEDDRNPWKHTPRSDVGFPSTNAIYATKALTNLAIQGVSGISLEGERNREVAKERWKLWFAEVKEGVRSFRFEGDPQYYNLNGSLKPEEMPPEITLEPGLTRWVKLLKDPESLAKDARMAELSHGLRLTVDRGVFSSADAQAVHLGLKDRLLKSEGPAEYYRNKIEEEWKEMEAEKDPSRKVVLMEKISRLQDEAFPTLALLPEPATVRVLGEFLFDDRERLRSQAPETEDEEGIRWWREGMAPNSSHAWNALLKLPLKSPPIDPDAPWDLPYHRKLEPWRAWFLQVKAGKRTFRFAGDPREYNLQGPVAEAARPASEAK